MLALGRTHYAHFSLSVAGYYCGGIPKSAPSTSCVCRLRRQNPQVAWANKTSMGLRKRLCKVVPRLPGRRLQQRFVASPQLCFIKGARGSPLRSLAGTTSPWLAAQQSSPRAAGGRGGVATIHGVRCTCTSAPEARLRNERTHHDMSAGCHCRRAVPARLVYVPGRRQL